MKRMVLLFLLVTTACSKPSGKVKPGAENAAPASSEADEHRGVPKRVHVPASVVADAKIKTVPASKEALSLTLALPGEVVADPDKTARISSPVAGRIEDVKFTEGSTVKKGDVLAIVRVPELGKVRAAYAATLSKGKAARANADRTKVLWDQRLASEQAYLDAKATADALDVEAQALGDQLSAMGATNGSGSAFLLTLRAPRNGIAIARDAVVGQPITAEQVLGTVADMSEVWFLGRVFEKDLGRLRRGSRAEVQLNAYPDEHFTGTVEYIGRQVDPVARTVTARIRLKDRDELLRVGLFGTARVETEEKEKHAPLIVVPRSAVTEIAGKSVVFVQQPDDFYEVHEVALGDAALGKVEVLSGLREGENVVIDGVFSLKSVVMKSAIAEEE